MPNRVTYDALGWDYHLQLPRLVARDARLDTRGPELSAFVQVKSTIRSVTSLPRDLSRKISEFAVGLRKSIPVNVTATAEVRFDMEFPLLDGPPTGPADIELPKLRTKRTWAALLEGRVTLGVHRVVVIAALIGTPVVSKNGKKLSLSGVPELVCSRLDEESLDAPVDWEALYATAQVNLATRGIHHWFAHRAIQGGARV